MRTSRLLVVVILAAAAVAPAFAQTVHVVHGTGAALQAAVDAAADGDTLLVHGGPYAPLSLPSASLTIAAEPAGGVDLDALTVAGLAAGKRVVIAGFRLQGSTASVTVSGCAGSVRLEDLTVAPKLAAAGGAGVSVSASADVALARCTVIGAGNVGTPGSVHDGAAGVLCSASDLALYDCSVRGARGAHGGFTTTPSPYGPGDGGAGMSVSGTSVLFVGGGALTGGDGGRGHTSLCCCGLGVIAAGSGGAVGAPIAGSGTVARFDVLESPGAGGAGGTGAWCAYTNTVLPDGAPGAAGAPSPGTLLPGAHARLDVAALVREGTTLSLGVTGAPGNPVWLALSTGTRWQYDPLFAGVFLFGPTARRVVLGTIPASGTLGVSLPVGLLPPGQDSLVRTLQVMQRAPGGQYQLGGPSGSWS